MPLNSDGTITGSLRGRSSDMHEQLRNKIQEMRSELRHIERSLDVLDAQLRARAPLSELKPNVGTLYLWMISITESWLSFSWGAFGSQKTHEAIADFKRRLDGFTVVRSWRA